MASYSWMPILEEVQAYLLAYEVESTSVFDDNVYLGAPLGAPFDPFVVLDWSPTGSTGTNLPQNNLMVDSDEITTITIYSTVENGDGTNAITQDLQRRLNEAQKEMEIALNLWLYVKVPVEINPEGNSYFTDWSKKIYSFQLSAKPITIQFSGMATVSTAVEFTIQIKYNDNNAI